MKDVSPALEESMFAELLIGLDSNRINFGYFYSSFSDNIIMAIRPKACQKDFSNK